jgi:hypothetical protein
MPASAPALELCDFAPRPFAPASTPCASASLVTPGSTGRKTDRLAAANRRKTMSTKSKIVVLAALATLVAAPAFAMDQDTAAVTINSGRYLPELMLQVPSGAFASANPGRAHVNQARAFAPTGGSDFQLRGRGLGE